MAIPNFMFKNMRSSPVAFLLCVLMVWSSSVLAQSSTPPTAQLFAQKADGYIKQLLTSIPDIPGLIMVVVKDDQPVFMKAYGWADREQQVKADENTLYYIASATKSFTAMAAALLDYEGKIRLDDPMRKYLPNIAFKHPIPNDQVTIRNLLTHTSGITNDALTFRMAYTGDIEPAALLKVFRDETILIDSNYGKYNYTNLGYNIYTMVLDQYLGKKWQDLVQEKVLTPLGMKHTTAYISRAAKNKWTVAIPYMAFGENGPVRSWLDKQDNNMQSAGGIYTSLKDLGTWLRVNLNDGKLNGKQVIPVAVMKACHTGYTTTAREVEPFTGSGAYGLGWQIGQYKQEKVIYHFGGFPGFRSHISFMPDQKLGVAIIVNEGNIGGRATNLLSTYAYDWWLQKGGIDSLYDQQLQQLVTVYGNAQKRMQQELVNRAKRPSQLSQPLEAYKGKYEHPYYGVMEVLVQPNGLVVKMGNMESASTAYTIKESIRVELIPGTGEVLQFKVGTDGKVEGVVYNKAEYVRK
jgi:CubicO group peptidase (beta-lactamase class C family)